MVVKLSTPWNLNYDQQLIVLQKQDDFCFEVNNFCNNCDVWIIWGGLNKAEEVNVPPENIIYIADECYAERSYNMEFLSQFNKIASAMIVDLKLVREVAKEKKYTFISTGMSSFKEIDNSSKSL